MCMTTLIGVQFWVCCCCCCCCCCRDCWCRCCCCCCCCCRIMLFFQSFVSLGLLVVFGAIARSSGIALAPSPSASPSPFASPSLSPSPSPSSVPRFRDRIWRSFRLRMLRRLGPSMTGLSRRPCVCGVKRAYSTLGHVCCIVGVRAERSTKLLGSDGRLGVGLVGLLSSGCKCQVSRESDCQTSQKRFFLFEIEFGSPFLATCSPMRPAMLRKKLPFFAVFEAHD